MTQETLEINNKFGPFNQAFELELAPLTVFIGPQGTGKSLISQFLYFFRDIEYLLANFDRTTSPKRVVKKIIEAIRAGEKSEQAFAPLIFDNVHIAYSQRETEKIERTISLKKRYAIDPIFNFKKEVEEWLVEYRKPGLAGQVKNNALFFPAERTFVSHVINSAPSLLGNSALSLATRHLIDFLSVEVADAHKKWQKNPHEQPKQAREIAQLVNRALGGHAICVGNGDFKNTWQFIPSNTQIPIEMEMASSGQMDTWPLVASIQAIFAEETLRRPKFLHIEEPETHLHPTAQMAMVKMLAYLVNQGFHLLITTHSLFIAYALNNLIMAHIKLGSEKTVKNMPAPQVRLAPDKVTAYLFAEGTVQNIFEDEQIDEGLLGEILSRLETEFNHLMTYQFLWGQEENGKSS